MSVHINHLGKNKASSFLMMLMLLAFVLKAVIPAGFMPGTAADGMMTMVICSGMGEKTITVPAGDQPLSDHTDDTADKSCAFQLLASAKTILPPLDVVLTLPSSTQYEADNRTPVFAIITPANIITARGPPALV